MLSTSVEFPWVAETSHPISYVGDNLDRLLGLLEAARVEEATGFPSERDAGYRALAAAIASAERGGGRRLPAA